jgi:hypothetical protein
MKRKTENEHQTDSSKKAKVDSDEFEKRLAFVQPFAQRKFRSLRQSKLPSCFP